MAEYGQKITETFVVASALATSDFEHKFVGVNSAGTLIAPTDKGADAIGILEIGGSQGQAASVTVFGITKIRAGAALPGNALISAATSGFAVAVTSGEFVLGINLSVVASGYLASALISRGATYNIA